VSILLEWIQIDWLLVRRFKFRCVLTQFVVATLCSNGWFWPERVFEGLLFFYREQMDLGSPCFGRRFKRQEKFSSVSLMLECLARKRRGACCCCKKLMVLGFIPCLQFVHTPYFRHPLVLFSFFYRLNYTFCPLSFRKLWFWLPKKTTLFRPPKFPKIGPLAQFRLS